MLAHLHTGLAEFRKLTLVSAPAGYGKTTLVVDWIQSLGSETRVAWISLDEGDNDPTRFLSYWISALQNIDASVGQSAKGLLGLPQLPPFQTIMDELINDLAGLESQIVMVLDDYHIITTCIFMKRWNISSTISLPRSTWSSPPARTHRCRWRACVLVGR